MIICATYLPHLSLSLDTTPNHAAGDFATRAAGGLGVKIVGATVDYDGLAEDIPHGKAIGFHRQVCPALGAQQRREIARVTGVRHVSGVVMATGIRKTYTGTLSTHVNVQGKETWAIVLRQAGYPGNDKDAPMFLIKLHRPGQAGCLESTADMCGCVRACGVIPHDNHLNFRLCKAVLFGLSVASRGLFPEVKRRQDMLHGEQTHSPAEGGASVPGVFGSVGVVRPVRTGSQWMTT